MYKYNYLEENAAEKMQPKKKTLYRKSEVHTSMNGSVHTVDAVFQGRILSFLRGEKKST